MLFDQSVLTCDVSIPAEEKVPVTQSQGTFYSHLHCQLLCDHLYGTCASDADDSSYSGMLSSRRAPHSDLETATYTEPSETIQGSISGNMVLHTASSRTVVLKKGKIVEPLDTS